MFEVFCLEVPTNRVLSIAIYDDERVAQQNVVKLGNIGIEACYKILSRKSETVKNSSRKIEQLSLV